MPQEDEAVESVLEIAGMFPAEMPVGVDVYLDVRVHAPVDLCGGRVTVATGPGTVSERVLGERQDGFNPTGEFSIPAPDVMGEFAWRLDFPRQEIGGCRVAESSLTLTVRTQPHRPSLAVWGADAPVRSGEAFSVVVGAKCPCGCGLTAGEIRIRDEAGAVAGHGVLGATPWPGTVALQWAEIALVAPAPEGPLTWTAEFCPTQHGLPHAAASAAFGFRVVRRPEHRVTIRVVERGTATPIEGVQIALGPYRAATDPAGAAEIEAAAGSFDLTAWKPEFASPPVRIEVAGDTQLRVEMERLPEEVRVWG